MSILADEIRIGDKVYCGTQIGTVIGITLKAKKIKVQYKGYTETYNKYGYRSFDSWHTETITKLTPEMETTITLALTKRKFLHKVSSYRKWDELSVEQLQAIVDIIEGGDKE